jgi:hypothetical protein
MARWASAYRSKANEAWLKRHGRISQIHWRRPNGKKSKVRALVEHVFAHEKHHMGLFTPTIVIKRAEAKITLANLGCNIARLLFHERRAAAG